MHGQLFRVDPFRVTKVAERFDDIVDISSAVSAGSSRFAADLKQASCQSLQTLY